MSIKAKKVSKILLVGSLPPPYNGQSAAFSPIVGSFAPGEAFLVNITKYRSFIGNTLWTMLGTLYYFAFYRFDTVYFTSSRSMLGFVKDIPLLLLGRWLKKRMVNHLHGANFKSFYDNSGLLKPLIGYCYRKVDTSIVLFEEMRKEFSDFPSMKVRVIGNCYEKLFDLQDDSALLKQSRVSPLTDLITPGKFPAPLGQNPAPGLCRGVDTDLITPGKFPAPLGQNPAPGLCRGVVYLSGLMKSKGILEFLDACEVVLQHRRDVTFTIAGLPCSDNFLGKRAIAELFFRKYGSLKKQFPDHIQYVGEITGQAKVEMLYGSDIFVLPTWHPSEAFPISILEAMRSGNAIVSTAHNFLPSLVKPENGILVNPHSISEIAEAIETLLRDPVRLQTIQQHNTAFAHKEYNQEKYVNAVRSVCQ